MHYRCIDSLDALQTTVNTLRAARRWERPIGRPGSRRRGYNQAGRRPGRRFGSGSSTWSTRIESVRSATRASMIRRRGLPGAARASSRAMARGLILRRGVGVLAAVAICSTVATESSKGRNRTSVRAIKRNRVLAYPGGRGDGGPAHLTQSRP
jgi:hypothetical protein